MFQIQSKNNNCSLGYVAEPHGVTSQKAPVFLGYVAVSGLV
jgi:hypothetical protein